MITKRQLKIAYLLGHFSSVCVRITQSMLGAPSLVFPVEEIKNAINDVLTNVEDPFELKEVGANEINEVLELLGLEEYAEVGQ